MSKKILIISFVILLVLAIALLAYYFLLSNGQPGTSGTSIFKNFLPFGGDNSNQNTDNNTNTNNNNSNQNTTDQGIDMTKKLIKISSEPVSGVGIQDVQAGTVVRYAEKATGHVYEVEMFSPRKDRISNITIPFVYESIWGNKNNSAALVNLDDNTLAENIYAFNINPSVGSSTEKTGLPIKIDSNVSGVVVSGNNIFYLKKFSNGAEGRLTTFDNKNNKVVFKTVFSEYNTQYINDKIIALNSKPYNSIPGFLYYLDPTSGKTRRVMGDINGLTTTPDPTGARILYLGLSNNLTFGIYNTINKSDVKLNPVTYPEKCVWGKLNKDIIYCAVPKGNIDSDSLIKWYQGYDQYSDNIWVYDTKNNSTFMIEDLETEGGEKIDVTKPVISDSDHYLIFINKQNGSLWGLDLTGLATSSQYIVD